MGFEDLIWILRHTKSLRNTVVVKVKISLMVTSGYILLGENAVGSAVVYVLNGIIITTPRQTAEVPGWS